jgi:2',3'-cyclic-nucleotide 2'-phosphodiesterase / 3'-nucleotidase
LQYYIVNYIIKPIFFFKFMCELIHFKMRCKYLKILAVISLIIISLTACYNVKSRHIAILETTDIHGVILPYDFIEKEKLSGSLANSATYITKERGKGDPIFLLDDGDNLQGQPEVYYYNFIDTTAPHFLSEAMNWLKYDACTVGNHDIEAGHSVYDRVRKEYSFPLLAANAIDIKTGKPYFTPYIILEKNHIRVAVLGLITPQIPERLPEELYSGIEFRDMSETAKLWMPEILKQKPDLVVGLFHSGFDKGNGSQQNGSHSDENGTAAVAFIVPGFDIIFCGHDHKIANEKIVNSAGDSVLILNGGSRSENIARADITFSGQGHKNGNIRKISGGIIKVKNYDPDTVFINNFKKQDELLNLYVNRVIGTSRANVSSRDSYFGSSAFVDMIHALQLEITGADISFAAPLSFDVTIPEGEVTVGDMFKLYRFENMLYTMNLSGEEIHKYLEFSYGQWFNTMKSPGDYLLKLRLGKDGKPVLTEGKVWLKGLPYNFDSAAGIDYVVDVRKPEGDRVSIRSLSNGKPFEMNKIYKVALNSYRGNGSGGHLTEGAGLDAWMLKKRLITSTDRDLRYYILKSIEEKKSISPAPLNNWKIIPEEWARAAEKREYPLLFGTER